MNRTELITNLRNGNVRAVARLLTLIENEDEKSEVIKEGKEILDVEDVIASILLVDDLRIQKN